MAEIKANRCQNGDMNQSLQIKRDVKPYLTKSYVMGTFLCQRMFNPLTQTDEHLIEELAVHQNSNACLHFLSCLQVSSWNKTVCQLYAARGLVDPNPFNTLSQGNELFLRKAFMQSEFQAGYEFY